MFKILSLFSLVGVLVIVTIQVLAATKGEEFKSLQRFPASLSLGLKFSESVNIPISDIAVIDLSCLEMQKQVEVEPSVGLVRVSGQWCGLENKLKAQSSIVQNRATGLFATVFNMPKHRFSSDLIALADGSNSVSITVQDLSGQTHLYQLEIIRK